jgi:alanyl-tRNA synthetase
MATEKLYDARPYDTEFTSEVVSCAPGKAPGTWQLVLAGTLFFPEEGGQTPDRGTIDGAKVCDVQIQDEVITHTVKRAEPFAPGASVHGVLDWDHRFSNMQNHSGEHILSGLLHSLYGFENVGFHLSDREVTLDTSGQLTKEQLDDLERRANEVVYRNVPVTCVYPPKEALAKLSYRSKKEIDGPVRIVTIEGVDVCACCAPHVAHTGEIGLIRILDVMRTSSGMRLTILCGGRALADTRKKEDTLAAISHLVNLPKEEAAAGVQRFADEIAAKKEEIKSLQVELTAVKLAAIPGGQTKNLFLFEGPLPNIVQRNFVNGLCEKTSGLAGVFAGSPQGGYVFIIGGRGRDAREAASLLREKLGARGGGKPEMVTGSVHAEEKQIREALAALS